MFLVLMAKKENIQPIDITTAILWFLKIDNNHSKQVIDFGNKTLITEEQIKQLCDEYNNKISKQLVNDNK